MADESSGDEVTWEAADRGATCALGCIAAILITGGVGVGIWGAITGGVWQVIVAALCLIGAAGVIWFVHSPRRGRWEVSFYPGRRVVEVYMRVEGEEHEREIPFDDIAEIRLEEITRDVTAGEDMPYLLPVFVLRNGDQVALDRRMSVRDPERASEIVERMEKLVGLTETEEASADASGDGPEQDDR